MLQTKAIIKVIVARIPLLNYLLKWREVINHLPKRMKNKLHGWSQPNSKKKRQIGIISPSRGNNKGMFRTSSETTNSMWPHPCDQLPNEILFTEKRAGTSSLMIESLQCKKHKSRNRKFQVYTQNMPRIVLFPFFGMLPTNQHGKSQRE